MTEHQTLKSYLEEWAGEDRERQAIADTCRIIAESCCAISEIIALGPLAGTLARSMAAMLTVMSRKNSISGPTA